MSQTHAQVLFDQLNTIVQQAIDEERFIVNTMAHPQREVRSWAQQVSDAITRFSGSIAFLIINGGVFLLWVLLNTLPVCRLLPWAFFDPYPFGFLTMVVSLEAIFLSCFVLISQNRQEEKDRQRNESDYMINLKAEIEVRSLHQKMDLLLQEQIKTLYDTQLQQLALLESIQKKLHP